MVNRKILLIDDDIIFFQTLSIYMRPTCYEILYAQNGKEGLTKAEEEPPDLVLLDVMMPGMSGWDVCKILRENSKIPIIMLTAKSEETDVLRGFQLGVDDYVIKPFSFAELEARIQAVLSRAKDWKPAGSALTSEGISINFERKKVMVAGKNVELTPTEFKLLETLARHANRTIPVSRLLTEVWGPFYEGEDQHVKQIIWSLRKKIETDPDDPKHLITRRGYGYRFE